jgi:DNA-binding MarR family transcriptional regulator
MIARQRIDRPRAEADSRFRVGEWPMHAILAIARGHVRNMGIVLDSFDCSPLVWRVLSIVCERDKCSVGQLADIAVIERSNLSRIVDGMESDGLVTKIESARDRREIRISVTPKGRALFARSLPTVLDYYGRFLGGVTADEKDMFMNVLAKIERNVCGSSAKLLER